MYKYVDIINNGFVIFFRCQSVGTPPSYTSSLVYIRFGALAAASQVPLQPVQPAPIDDAAQRVYTLVAC